MACHFSAYSTGISNAPECLPKGSVLILNDRMSIQGHDPELVASQLAQLTEKLKPDAILLDFQRRDNAQTSAIVQAVI